MDHHPAMQDLLTIFPSITDPARDPRTTAILGCAYMEKYLQEAICNLLPDLNAGLIKKLFRGTGALAPVGARIDLATAMGILGANTRHNCVTLTEIRNKFAHSFNVHTFDDPVVATIVDRLRPMKLKSDDPVEMEKARADRFVQVLTLTVGALAVHLNSAKQQAQFEVPD